MKIKVKFIKCECCEPKPSFVESHNRVTVSDIKKKKSCVGDGKIKREISAVMAKTSSDKEARVRILKKKFAGTIMKARKTLFENDESKRICEKIRNRMRNKEMIEKQRLAARAALEKMEHCFTFEDNQKSIEELEMLSGHSMDYCLYGFPLKKIGLSLKDGLFWEEYDQDE